MSFENQIESILGSAEIQLSDISPSDWNEKFRVMTSEVSPRTGKFSYEYTPYLKEVVNCLSQADSCRIVSIMKGAQVGFSTGVIEAGIGWIIAESPSNILFLTGHADLSEEAVTGKIDNLIDNTGIRHLIRANTQRKRNTRTGDTNKAKEFAGGSLVAGSAGNHKLLRQRSVRYGFIDDFDAAKNASKESGATTKMIEQRFAAYNATKKIFYISTPELKETSNIEPVYLKGDQRRYHIPCPCCGEYIVLEWEIKIEGTEKEMGGITWQLDDNGKLIRESVGFICYKCGGFFDDSDKTELLALGQWIPTAEPINPDYRSYHLSALYAPIGMDPWLKYVQDYLEANPVNQAVDEEAMKAFTNLCLGYPWEEKGEAPKANALQANTRPYEIGIIPEELSIKDGNGKIVLLTLAIDLNGKIEDARADYELVAWSESGATYSVDQGSIGTFIPAQKEDQAALREWWTYEADRERSIWPKIDELLEKKWVKDNGKTMMIFIAGVDAPSHFAKQAYHYIDKAKATVYALKGKDTEHKVSRFGADVSLVNPSRSRQGLWLIEVNLVKDDLAALMKLKHRFETDERQPIGFMNFPTPSLGKYTYSGFYRQFEGEHRVLDRNAKGTAVGMRWIKKNSAAQNHFWDCRVYNIALKEMFVTMIGKELKEKDFTWRDYVNTVLPK